MFLCMSIKLLEFFVPSPSDRLVLSLLRYFPIPCLYFLLVHSPGVIGGCHYIFDPIFLHQLSYHMICELWSSIRYNFSWSIVSGKNFFKKKVCHYLLCCSYDRSGFQPFSYIISIYKDVSFLMRGWVEGPNKIDGPFLKQLKDYIGLKRHFIYFPRLSHPLTTITPSNIILSITKYGGPVISHLQHLMTLFLYLQTVFHRIHCV